MYVVAIGLAGKCQAYTTRIRFVFQALLAKRDNVKWIYFDALVFSAVGLKGINGAPCGQTR